MLSSRAKALSLYAIDKRKCLSVVSKWPNLGPHRDPILRAQSCYCSPVFYRSIGADVDKIYSDGYIALYKLLFDK